MRAAPLTPAPSRLGNSLCLSSAHRSDGTERETKRARERWPLARAEASGGFGKRCQF
ncbi:unnamed protein product [Prunus armeniaca]